VGEPPRPRVELRDRVDAVIGDAETLLADATAERD